MKSFEKDGVTFEAHSVLEEARLKRLGFKEVKPAEEKPVEEKEKSPAEMNKEAVEKVNKKGGK